MIKGITEIINPAIAHPLGRLNTPMKENNTPKNQRIQFKIGSQQNTKAQIDNTNPATPNPLDFFSIIINI